jgi:hypothetical protein
MFEVEVPVIFFRHGGFFGTQGWTLLPQIMGPNDSGDVWRAGRSRHPFSPFLSLRYVLYLELTLAYLYN